MDRSDPLIGILDYIMNRARHAELDAMDEAIKRRRASSPQTISDINIEGMAHEFARQLNTTDQVDIQGMTKRLVASMILEQEPNISPEHLEELIDHYVPGGKKKAASEKVPKDILITMLDQFIRYSTGRMPDRELKELKLASPDWIEKYWNIFSEDTRRNVADVIRGKMSTDQFWRLIDTTGK